MFFLFKFFLVSYLVVFLFFKIEINGVITHNIFHRMLASIVCATIITIFVGLPILGLIALFRL